MKRILFLDDNPARRRWAARELGPGNYLAAAATVNEAIRWLKWGEPDEDWVGPFWDLVYLDHDLGDETFVDPSRPDCGMAVVRWIVANRPKIGAAIVHSMATPQANRMVQALRGAGYEAKYHAFYKMAYGDTGGGGMTDSDPKDDAQARLANLTDIYGLTVGGVYEHYKGGVYVIVALSVHEATGEPFVTYSSNLKGTCWTRPLDNFVDPVGDGHSGTVRRFRRVNR